MKLIKSLGSADIRFIENDGYNVSHWSAFISIPMHASRWVWLGANITEEQAIEKADKMLDYYISMIGTIGL